MFLVFFVNYKDTVFLFFQEAAFDADKEAIAKFDAMVSRSNAYAPDGMTCLYFSNLPSFLCKPNEDNCDVHRKLHLNLSDTLCII